MPCKPLPYLLHKWISTRALHICVSIGVKFDVGNLHKTFLRVCVVSEGRRRSGKAVLVLQFICVFIFSLLICLIFSHLSPPSLSLSYSILGRLLIIQKHTPCWKDPGFSAAYYCPRATRMFFLFGRSRQGLRMIVCYYSNLRLLVTRERIIETCSMLGSVFDSNSRIRRCFRGILLARRQYQDLYFMHRWYRYTYFLRLRTGRYRNW